MILYDLDSPLSFCEHGRDCHKCPNEMLNEAIKYMKRSAEIMEHVHESFDGITVKSIFTSYGDTEIKMVKK